MQEKIGFTWQQYLDGACGKYSMRHCLLLLGIPVTKKEANKATAVPPIATRLFGTNPATLQQGLNYFGCQAIERSYRNPNKLRHKLDRLLAIGCPSIISVEDDEHWAVIAGKQSKNNYYWIDSADDDLIGYWDWSDIVDWIDNKEYSMIGVKPKNDTQLRHSLVLNFNKIYLLLDDDELCEYWGYYLEDLLEMFDSPIRNSNAITAKEFFHKYASLAFNASCYYYYYSNKRHMNSELERYKQIAFSHNLSLSVKAIPTAIANLSAALTCLACIDN